MRLRLECVSYAHLQSPKTKRRRKCRHERHERLLKNKKPKGFTFSAVIDQSLGWMVIPYLAIVACAMLAANSPSTLEGIVYDGANVAVPDKYEASFFSARIQEATRTYRPLAAVLRQLEGYNPVEMAFEGRFRTVKLWKRGLNKRQWVQEAVNDYEAAAVRRRFDKEGIAADELRESLTLDARDCSYVAVGSLFLVLVPSLLAFLMSYNTPRAGLSVSLLFYLILSCFASRVVRPPFEVGSEGTGTGLFEVISEYRFFANKTLTNYHHCSVAA